MTGTGADPPGRERGPAPPQASGAPRAPAGETGALIALTALFALAGGAAVLAVARLLLSPVEFGDGYGEQNQDSESIAYIGTLVLFAPLAIALVSRTATRIAGTPNRGRLETLALALTVLGLAVVLAVRAASELEWADGMATVALAAGVWMLVAAGCLGAATRRPLPLLASLQRHRDALGWAAAGLALGLVLAVTDLGSIDVAGLVVGGLVAGALGAALFREPELAQRLSLRKIPGKAIDVVFVLLLILAVPNLLVFPVEAAATDPVAAFETSVTQSHQGFFLGPANQVLGGNALLVDTVSQYGVGSIYFTVGWFQVAPIGYGTLGFLEGVLSALAFAAAFAVLRIAGIGRLLAISAMTFAVIVLVFSLEYPLGALLQHGALRFGLPLALLVLAVIAERRPGRARPLHLGELAVLGLSSIWALEGFLYTLAAFVAISVCRAWLAPAGTRVGSLARAALGGGAAILIAHVLFAAATLAATGQLPDWGQYIAYLTEFLGGEVGEVTYDFSFWSPGILVAAALVSSAVAFVVLAMRTPETLRRDRATCVALAGSTAYGIALFSYFVNRSADHIVPYVCLPLVMAAAFWLHLLLRDASSPRLRAGACGLTLSIAALAIAVAWPAVPDRFSESALAHAAPRGESLRIALERLWDPPPLAEGAVEGEQVLRTQWPAEESVPVIAVPDLGIEILMRSGKSNALPFGDPLEDSFVPEERLPLLAEAVEDLRPGDRLLFDAAAWATLMEYLVQPPGDPLAPAAGASGRLVNVQRWLLAEIAERFASPTGTPQPGGFVIAEL